MLGGEGQTGPPSDRHLRRFPQDVIDGVKQFFDEVFKEVSNVWDSFVSFLEDTESGAANAIQEEVERAREDLGHITRGEPEKVSKKNKTRLAEQAKNRIESINNPGVNTYSVPIPIPGLDRGDSVTYHHRTGPDGKIAIEIEWLHKF